MLAIVSPTLSPCPLSPTCRVPTENPARLRLAPGTFVSALRVPSLPACSGVQKRGYSLTTYLIASLPLFFPMMSLSISSWAASSAVSRKVIVLTFSLITTHPLLSGDGRFQRIGDFPGFCPGAPHFHFRLLFPVHHFRPPVCFRIRLAVYSVSLDSDARGCHFVRHAPPCTHFAGVIQWRLVFIFTHNRVAYAVFCNSFFFTFFSRDLMKQLTERIRPFDRRISRITSCRTSSLPFASSHSSSMS